MNDSGSGTATTPAPDDAVTGPLPEHPEPAEQEQPADELPEGEPPEDLADEDGDEDDVPLAAGADTPGSAADTTRLYLRAIGRVPLLSAADEVDLATRIEAGVLAAERLAKHEQADAAGGAARAGRAGRAERADLAALVRDGQRAKAHLVEANLRLVVSIAKRYGGRGLALLDLVQEGNLGLIRAVEKFDYTRGYKFSTYATWWIRQSISRAVADQGRTIRIPVHLVETINRLLRTQRAMVQELGREPTPEELGATLDLPPARVVELQRIAREPVSLDSPVGPEDDGRLGDLIEDADAADPAELATAGQLRTQLAAVLAGLSERERLVIRLRYGLVDGVPHTLEAVGQECGVTRERIRQIEAKTLAKLRHPLRSRVLRDFLET